MRTLRLLASAALATLLAAVVAPAFGSEIGPSGTGLSISEVDARLADLEGSPGVSAADRAEIEGLYKRAKALLEAAKTDATVTAGYQAALETAPAEVRRLREQLADGALRPPDAAGLGVTEQTPLADMERRLAAAQAELSAAEATLAQQEDRLREQLERPAQARQELTRVQLALAEPGSPTAGGVGPSGPRVEAERALAAAQREARTAEAARLEQEIVSFNTRLPLLEARRDLADQQAKQLREQVRFLQALVGEKRRAEAKGTVERIAEVAREARDKHPVIQTAAQTNAEISRDLIVMTEQIEAVAREAGLTQERIREVTAAFRRTQDRLAVAGVDVRLAGHFRRERQALTRLVDDRARLVAQFTEGSRVPEGSAPARPRLDYFEIQEQRQAVANLQGRVDDLMERVEPTMAPDARAALRAELTTLISERQALLQRLDSAFSTYLREIGTLAAAQAGLEDASQAFGRYLDGQLLWLPSTYPVGMAMLDRLAEGFAWATSRTQWAGVRVTLVSDLQRNPATSTLAGIAILAILGAAPRVSRRVRRIAELVQRPATDRFGLSLEALLLSAIVSLPVPLTLGLLGWRLHASLETTDFSQALGHGLDVTSHVLFAGLLGLLICRPYGLGGAHFAWPPPALNLLRRQLKLLLLPAVPLTLATVVLAHFADEGLTVAPGRVAFFLMMLTYAYFLTRVLSPRGPIIQPLLAVAEPNRMARLWWFWYPIVVGGPLALAGLAGSGYYYTAVQMARPFLQTIALLAVAAVLYGLALRWLAVSRRSLALQLAREDREAALALETASGRDSTAGIPLASARDDLQAIDAQTRQLLKTILLLGSPFALYAVWSDLLPAFTLFEDVRLWHQSVVVEGQTVITPVTLGNLLAVILIGIVTGIAARNLPGALEIGLLRHLRLKRGSRYAIKTLLQYTIVTLGIVVAFAKLGASWSQMQWLVAALGVGLGFGLQEIFANFISGIIILFERPVRVGDRVTVGSLTGTVSKISIRAVTITDFDRKEIIVPNKSLITGDVVNWSLSDPITRVNLKVGIAYGSDVERAHRVILETVRSLPLVRQDPRPEVWFAGFGESSLDFDIYVFAGELSDRFPLMHEVNTAIERALRENGFEIPFPQRDLHLRSIDPGARSAWRGTNDPAPGV